ncbi:MAG: hypothetical protein QME83_11570 [Thermodesulfobacteriota bacterium]|nr:hypothetical protein [Thermodesulfobacteriota bacterium]
MKKKILIVCLILFFSPVVWSQEKIETPPEWKVGDKWVYSWKNQKGKSGTGSNSIVEADKLVERVSCYVMQKPNRLVYYNKELQPIAEADLKGKIYALGPPTLWIFWPLEVGKDIEQTAKWKNLRTGDKIEFNLNGKVEKIENISTPAGEFLAYKIVTILGNNWYERWYSHKVKNYVKMVDHLKDDTVENVLINYQLSD